MKTLITLRQIDSNCVVREYSEEVEVVHNLRGFIHRRFHDHILPKGLRRRELRDLIDCGDGTLKAVFGQHWGSYGFRRDWMPDPDVIVTLRAVPEEVVAS